MASIKRYVFIILGFLCFGLGIIGTIIPVLPTTPLVLLSGFLFAKSSKRFEKRVKDTKIYREYCADYAAHRSIPREKKRKKILPTIYVLMGFSIFLAPILWVKALLISLTIFLTIMVLFLIPDTEETFDDEGNYIGTNDEVRTRYEKSANEELSEAIPYDS